jgi:hypothetical protein
MPFWFRNRIGLRPAIGMAIVGYEVMKQKRQKREEQEKRA